MKNWKTTLTGGLAAILAYGITAFPEYASILTPASALFAALFALVSKDHTTTGV